MTPSLADVASVLRAEVGTPIVDFHTHIWGDRTHRDADTLIRAMDRYDIAWIGVSALIGGYQPTPGDVRNANDAVAAFQRRDPQRVRGFCYLNPRHGVAAIDELRRCVERHGFEFIKLWVSARADEPCVFPIIEKSMELGMAVLQHAFCKATGLLDHESTPAHVATLARRYPRARIVMAHMGADFIFGCNAIRDCPNVATDISGSTCETGMVDYALRVLGAERIVFGTDAPGASVLNNIHKVLDAPLTQEQKRMIFHDNAGGLRRCTT
jgi:uncharacterized protein